MRGSAATTSMPCFSTWRSKSRAFRRRIGASSLPIIARMLRDEFGRRVHRSAYPSAATAIGLAIALDDRAGFELTERFSHHFGVFREARGGAEVAFDPIFTEGTEQPSKAG